MMLHERLGVGQHHSEHCTQQRGALARAASKAIDQITKQPRLAQTTATNDHTIATGFGNHSQCIVGAPDIAVAQHRDALDLLFQRGDGLPPRARCIVLLGGAGVECNHHCASIATNFAGVDICDQVVIDAHAKFARNRNAVPTTRTHRCTHDFGEQILFQGHSGAAALARDFGGWATEVQVDVIHQIFTAQHLDRFFDDDGVAAIQLQTAKRFIRGKRHHRASARIAVDQRSRHDHFVDIHQPRPEVATK